jgi:hypothetical protein
MDLVWIRGIPLGRRRRLLLTCHDYGPRVREWALELRGWRQTHALRHRRYRSLPSD